MAWRNEGTFHLMRRAMQAHSALWRERLPQLTPVQYSVLLSLKHLAGADQRTIGDASSVEPTTMANLVARMESAGLLSRTPDPNDRRRLLLTLTTHGAETLRTTTPIVRSIRDEALGCLSDQDAHELRRILLAMDLTPEAPRPEDHTTVR